MLTPRKSDSRMTVASQGLQSAPDREGGKNGGDGKGTPRHRHSLRLVVPDKDSLPDLSQSARFTGLSVLEIGHILTRIGNMDEIKTAATGIVQTASVPSGVPARKPTRPAARSIGMDTIWG
jgi:hypothetical protein